MGKILWRDVFGYGGFQGHHSHFEPTVSEGANGQEKRHFWIQANLIRS